MRVFSYPARRHEVLVIGSALSILTGTLHEIRQVNNERSRDLANACYCEKCAKCPKDVNCINCQTKGFARL